MATPKKESKDLIVRGSSTAVRVDPTIIPDTETRRYVEASNTATQALDPEWAMANRLIRNGIKRENWIYAVEKSSGLLSKRDKERLLKVGEIMRAFEEANPRLTNALRRLNQNPNEILVIEEAGKAPVRSDKDLSLTRGDDNDLRIAPETYEATNISLEEQNEYAKYLKDLYEQSEQKYLEAHEETEESSTYETPVRYASNLSRTVNRPPPDEEEVSPESYVPREGLTGGMRSIGNTGQKMLQQGVKALSSNAKRFGARAAQSVIGSVAPALAQGALIAGGIIAGVGAFIGMLIAWFISILVYLAIFAFVVVIILFIINSGAYLVPPGGFGPPIQSGGTSQFIQFSKTASPAGPLDNSWNNQDQDITYTIAITPLQEDLTNVSFGYNCSVISFTPKSCPLPHDIVMNGEPIPGNTMPPPPPAAPIPAHYAYIITYKTTVSANNYNDSRITDNFSITATVNGTIETVWASASIRIGNPPDSCPEGWPVLPENGEVSLEITQGPGLHSAYISESIDIGASIGHTVTARHAGIAHVFTAAGSVYGCHVDIESTCNGKTFYSRYAHLNDIFVNEGEALIPGDQVGLSGGDPLNPPPVCGTGYTTGAHLHYEFRNFSGPGGAKIYPTDDPPFMVFNYLWDGVVYNFIPKQVPRNCYDNCAYIP
ncbi:hypothetical protein A3A76_02175 [Candidatus Woesebacteria bacterium RIFCSPLOWO2_01_FULL_39_23]|uniref:M23ase beta-sheet core domain-containing protein n=1 Tax=Candidatus Woesebacteria bacterium RIFCSPHIGHO2_01_FULL_40_22 TaxID=1802499 RepID=A0A1F7YFV4_9BACT|nr:MAG: hypothetical protein A2141_03330 [Candidatus Woesebacteria bacterium RBG_16_40_11]OGM26207.1 MAG: hypothetical protein A2628_02610 [Candidatus Woesebacteria bacterium RIFCSPHIGHO2_01_FULL_40_22]OGM36224.1 MAG: hypothetical protein A3E41_02025 [Candidatus Woesebacteria bacterium RIFCSPHIGHO2_12_FULL_38_9]OGM62365.1 MAG: hypothetical protein A3A76_02175 [Candidatus Woesebacteria bacterium RIFCSPLOWO2_01_FULL_39_23]